MAKSRYSIIFLFLFNYHELPNLLLQINKPSWIQINFFCLSIIDNILFITHVLIHRWIKNSTADCSVWIFLDGGDGFAGTVCEIGKSGSTTSPDKTVVVQWDSGFRSNYRVGYQGEYDLRVFDNAQIGMTHPYVISFWDFFKS